MELPGSFAHTGTQVVKEQRQKLVKPLGQNWSPDQLVVKIVIERSDNGQALCCIRFVHGIV
jgi:PhoPQ-activated pathogenicity-related protein